MTRQLPSSVTPRLRGYRYHETPRLACLVVFGGGVLLPLVLVLLGRWLHGAAPCPR